MNKEIKEKWIKALRSGEYKQGKSVLRDGDNFCCLGVLCDLAVKEGIIPEPKAGSVIHLYDGEYSVLSQSVQNWSGVKSEIGEFLMEVAPFPLRSNLATANDNGKTFTEIADIIEREF